MRYFDKQYGLLMISDKYSFLHDAASGFRKEISFDTFLRSAVADTGSIKPNEMQAIYHALHTDLETIDGYVFYVMQEALYQCENWIMNTSKESVLALGLVSCDFVYVATVWKSTAWMFLRAICISVYGMRMSGISDAAIGNFLKAGEDLCEEINEKRWACAFMLARVATEHALLSHYDAKLEDMIGECRRVMSVSDWNEDFPPWRTDIESLMLVYMKDRT